MPKLSSITNSLIRQVSKSSNKAILWSRELGEDIEVINCRTGQTIKGSKSFVCKSEMFNCWLTTYNLLKLYRKDIYDVKFLDNKVLNDHRNLTYNEVKVMAKEYQSVKLKVNYQMKINKKFDLPDFLKLNLFYLDLVVRSF